MLSAPAWQVMAGETLNLQSQRVVTQAQHLWIVREADASLSPDAPGPHCLVCESALTVRYAWRYPREWSRLPDVDLLALFH